MSKTSDSRATVHTAQSAPESSRLPAAAWAAGLLLQALAYALVAFGAATHRWAWLVAAVPGLALCAWAWRLRRPAQEDTFAPTSIVLPGSERAPQAHAQVLELKRELARYREIEKQLTQAKKEAESATMAKGEFLATMSHEIRTPLNGIIPLLDILLSTRMTDDQRDYLQTAYQSAKQLLSIVDDILDYSKIEANRLELELIGLNIKEIVDSVTRLLVRNAEAKGLKLSAHIDPNVRLAMRGDPVRLRQVLTNLVSNAIKFTERGSIGIEVKKRAETRTHTELLFCVTDTGIGLDTEVQKRLFKPFTQADASTTRQHGGTGLGLIICKRIVELMGGHIGVQSEPGRGSTFWFHVPLAKAVGDVQPTRAELRGARMLCLTTDTGLWQKLFGMFNTWGCKPTHTTVPADALAKLRSAALAGESRSFDFFVIDGATTKNALTSLLRNLSEPALAGLRTVLLQADDEPMEANAPGIRAVLHRQAHEPEWRMALQRLLDPGQTQTGAPELESMLPALPRSPLPEPMAPVRPVPAAPMPAGDPKAPCVLLVEDNAVNLQVAQRLLNLIGIRHEAVENGQLALERLRHKTYDAVLMDCQMPVMDGYLATRAIRKGESTAGTQKRVPIIAMTANAMAGDREKCLNAGMDDYLSKPLSRTGLEQALQRWTHWVPIAPSADATPARLPAVGATAARLPAPNPAARAAAAYASAPSTAHAARAIDAEIIQDLLELMGDEFRDLIRVYLEDTPKSIAQLERAAEHAHLEGLIAPAHSLKSTSANLGATALAELAKRIEHGARNGQLQGEPMILVAEVAAEYRQVAAELKQLIAGA